MAGLGWIAFSLTDRCQLACRHCLRDPSVRPTDIDPGLVERVVIQAGRHLHFSHAALTGGEPLLHPRFEQIVASIADAGWRWHLVTNGHALERRLFPLLARNDRLAESLDGLDISLDGADETTHDAIRGAGSFRKVMRAVALASASGVAFNVQMAVHAQNAGQIEQFGLLAGQLGARRAGFTFTLATGTPADRALFLDAAAWERIADRIVRLDDMLRIPVSATEGYPIGTPLGMCDSQRSEVLHVDVRGRLTLCCLFGGGPGPACEAEAVADLAATPLSEAHARLLDLVHRMRVEKNRQIGEREFCGWDLSSCNWCMAHFGKPHWTEAGRMGPTARRKRRRNVR